MRILKDFWAIIIILALMAGWFTTLCQRDTAIQRYQTAEFTVEQRDRVIDALETMCKFQAKEIDRLEEWDRSSISEVNKLYADIRLLEGRIRKMTGAYQIREMNLLQEIDRLRKELRGYCFKHLDTPPNQEPIETAPPIPGCR